jgi:hypothetical protein
MGPHTLSVQFAAAAAAAAAADCSSLFVRPPVCLCPSRPPCSAARPSVCRAANRQRPEKALVFRPSLLLKNPSEPRRSTRPQRAADHTDPSASFLAGRRVHGRALLRGRAKVLRRQEQEGLHLDFGLHRTHTLTRTRRHAGAESGASSTNRARTSARGAAPVVSRRDRATALSICKLEERKDCKSDGRSVCGGRPCLSGQSMPGGGAPAACRQRNRRVGSAVQTDCSALRALSESHFTRLRAALRRPDALHNVQDLRPFSTNTRTCTSRVSRQPR